MRSSPSAIVLALALAVPASAQPAPGGDPAPEIGAPYQIEGVTYTPVDATFDDVGRAELDGAVSAGISAAHRTLPLPSYAEVTALDTGRTILVRVERRGPMTGTASLGLSLAAFGQLGADPAAPLAVRVRRVNPQEYERALLRTGQPAPERLATPKPLLEVLRKLYDKKAPVVAAAAPPPASVEAAKPTPAAKPKPASPPASSGRFTVQAGAFASKANAQAVAARLKTAPVASGKLWVVRTGPFATRAEAEAALARAKAAGVADARILTGGK